MVVKNECQALCVAVEMEKRAIRIYERALLLVEDAQVRAGIEDILADEQQHLCRFNAMRTCHPVDAGEEQLLLSSLAAETLFQGGVMEMSRAHALQTIQDLYRHAAENEAHAVQTYAAFAEKCEDEAVKDAFLSIVREESRHLVSLKRRLEKL